MEVNNISDNNEINPDLNGSYLNNSGNDNLGDNMPSVVPTSRTREKNNTYLTNISVIPKNETSIIEQRDLTNQEKAKQPFHESIDYGVEETKQANPRYMANNDMNEDNSFEHKLLKEKENYERLSDVFKKYRNQKESELDEKEKSVHNLSITNKKLMAMLEELKREVDCQLDKVGIRQVTDKMKVIKETSLDTALKVKEKELKNKSNLLEILKKDNERLQKTVESYTDFNKVVELGDKLKLKEKENADLLLEIKTLNRTLEEHKKCEQRRLETEKDFKNLKDDLKKTKDMFKDMQNKYKEEEGKFKKTMDLLIAAKKEIEQLKKHKLGDLRDPKFADKLFKNLDVNKKTNDGSPENDMIDILGSPEIFAPTEKKTLRAKTIAVNNDEANQQIKVETPFIKRLFSSEERSRLEKLLSPSDLEKIEKKFEGADRSKISGENRLKSDLKLVQKKMREVEEQYEFMVLQYKETEQKGKISVFQVNEYKSEQKAYQRKLNEVQQNSEKCLAQLKEKDQENRILLGQLNDLRKVTKHKAVAPMDEDMTKQLEKLRINEYTSSGAQADMSNSNLEQHSKVMEESVNL